MHRSDGEKSQETDRSPPQTPRCLKCGRFLIAPIGEDTHSYCWVCDIEYSSEVVKFSEGEKEEED